MSIHHTTISLPLLFILIFLLLRSSESQYDISECSNVANRNPEFKALETIYSRGLGKLKNGFLYCWCNWTGVECDSESGVTGLTLRNRSLSSGNSGGFILEQLGSLRRLLYLDLGWNDLQEQIPSSLASNCIQLVSIRLDHNKLQGGLPRDLLSLPHLQILDLSSNLLGNGDTNTTPDPTQSKTSGSVDDPNVPHGQNWSCGGSLRFLNLSGNRLGTDGAAVVLESLMRCGSLQNLDLSNNSFSGPVPGKIFYPSSPLTSLDLSRNRFSGNLPREIGNLVDLSVLDASDNVLSGEIPPSLGNCRFLHRVHLQHNRFSGNISSTFENLVNLEELDLSDNNLSGPIPAYIFSLRRLKRLNLSFNDFEGDMNTTGGIFDDPAKVSLVGNPKLCGNPNLNLIPCLGSVGTPASVGSRRSGVSKAIVAAVIVPVAAAAVALLILLLWLLYRCKRSAKSNPQSGKYEKISPFRASPKVSYRDLQMATNGFEYTNLIGSGGVSSVYRGFLEREGKAVAVKVLRKEMLVDSNEFVEECCAMRRSIRHRNLVGILAPCADDGAGHFKSLVYELVPTGSLEMWLHREVVSLGLPSFRKWNLSLYQRMNIAIDVASALVHLHCGYEKPIVHCNLKPSNVLIAGDMTALVTDFGMSKFFPVDMVIQESDGYTAPECARGSGISALWDVYSFGILLLEMFTGKRPSDDSFGDSLSLHTYVLRRYPLHLEDTIDPLLISEETGGRLTDRACDCLRSIIHVALICSKEYPEDRMNISEALEKLERAKLAFLEVGGTEVLQQVDFDRVESTEPILG